MRSASDQGLMGRQARPVWQRLKSSFCSALSSGDVPKTAGRALPLSVGRGWMASCGLHRELGLIEFRTWPVAKHAPGRPS